MASFVVDASATLPWYFLDEATPWSNSILSRLGVADDAVVPAHWPTEVSNAFLVAFRRKRIQRADIAVFWGDLQQLPISIEPAISITAAQTVTDLAIQNTLTFYDAVYLELAIRRGLPIAPLDNALRQAALACGIELL